MELLYAFFGFIIGFITNSILTTHTSFFRNFYDKHVFKRHFTIKWNENLNPKELEDFLSKHTQETVKIKLNYPIKKLHCKSEIYDDGTNKEFLLVGVSFSVYTLVLRIKRNDLLEFNHTIHSGYLHIDGYFKNYKSGVSNNAQVWGNLGIYYTLIPTAKP